LIIKSFNFNWLSLRWPSPKGPQPRGTALGVAFICSFLMACVPPQDEEGITLSDSAFEPGGTLTVTGVTPSLGYYKGFSNGGAKITITGSGFESGTTVEFEDGAGSVYGLCANVNVISTTSIECETPDIGAPNIPVLEMNNPNGRTAKLNSFGSGGFDFRDKLSVSKIASGESHVCALLTTGDVYCWGEDGVGRLGQGASVGSSSSPLQVSLTAIGGENVTDISAGRYHSCVLTDGAINNIYCWGLGTSGQLGHGAFTSQDTLVQIVTGGLTFTSLKGGGLHTCGRASTGSLYCWGKDTNRELGDNATTDKNSPKIIAFTPLTGSEAIGIGTSHQCTINSSNELFCVGSDDVGQIGIGTANDPQVLHVTVGAPLNTGVIEISSSHDTNCTIGNASFANRIMCWGDNSVGQTGSDPVTPTIQTPTYPSGSPDASKLAVGQVHSCYIEFGSNNVNCFGGNDLGQLGDGTTSDTFTPVVVTNGGNATQLVTGYKHSCFVNSSDEAFCVGNNDNGQLGIGQTINASETRPQVVIQ